MPSMFHSVEKMRLTQTILFWFIFPSVIKCLSQRNCPPTLTDTSQNQIVICTTNSHSNKRNSIYLDVEFEAFPKPNVTWILNKHVGQEKLIYPGDRSRGYRPFQLRQDDDISYRYVASLRINELSEDDIDHEDNHVLQLENTENLVPIHITISTDENCTPSQNPRTGTQIAGCDEDDDEQVRRQRYHCHLRQDRHCRCHYHDCCSSDPEYSGAFKCQECIEREDNCFYCNKDGEDCLTFEQSASFRDICTLPKEIGDCRAYIEQWYYDTESQECEKFSYGGCKGNENRFETKSACEFRCLPQNGLNKAVDNLVQGCVKLGSNLLKQYKTNGENRSSRPDSRSLKKEFESLRCK